MVGACVVIVELVVCGAEYISCSGITPHSERSLLERSRGFSWSFLGGWYRSEALDLTDPADDLTDPADDLAEPADPVDPIDPIEP